MSDVNAIVDQTIQQYQAGKFNKPSTTMDDSKAANAAKEFEAVFISQMLTPMFEGIETDGMFGGGSAENIYKSMMLEEYGKLIAANGGIGIGSAVKAEMLQMQANLQGEGE
tara:strand:- start:807 stop:1139 length:333 start_codon:yes stop_codon:yes gene_type:complete